ncbi:hypothetical protein TruAng_002158 [Truncatella angustata]|nr:hypothetical protein TruAng_002158 [Truncatella angustata]
MENIQLLAHIIISITFAIGAVSFLGRWYSRGLIVRAFGWDDVFSIFLMLVNILQQAILYIFLRYGCGRHATTLSGDDLEQITKWLFFEEIFYMLTHWTIKQTFLMFYLRLSPSITFRRLVYGTMLLNAAFTVTNWLLAFLQCVPFDAIFHPALYPDADCIDKNILLMGPSVLNIIADVTILILPIPTVLKLQMSKRRKIAVISVISFGGSAVVVAACRFFILYELGHDPDTSYVLGKMVIVAGFEIQLAVIAVNLPSMKVLWTKLYGNSVTEESYVEDGSRSKSYSLSTLKRGMARNQKAGPVADVSITNHMASIFASESEEELWGKESQGNVLITKSVHISRADRDGSIPPGN